MPLLSIWKFELRPRLWPTIGAIAGIVVTAALGNWQLGRAAEKQALQDRYVELSRQPPVHLGTHEIRPENRTLRRVEVRGQFEPNHMVLLDNRVHNQVPGYHVVMPLRITGANRYVLVNRGWISATGDRARLPPVQTPPGEVAVRGIASIPSDRYLELSSEVVEDRVWQNLTLTRYRTATRLDVLPIVILQEDSVQDGLVRDWPAPDYGRKTHLAYAFQWFALAIAIALYYLLANARRHTETG